MLKTLLAVALSAVALSASADPRPYTHYHDDGRVVIGNEIQPKVFVTYEMDYEGRNIRVVNTKRCIDTRVNPHNNHLWCAAWRTTEERYVEGQRGYEHDHGYHRGWEHHHDRGYNDAAIPGAIIGGVLHEIQRGDHDDHRGDHDRVDHDRGNDRHDWNGREHHGH